MGKVTERTAHVYQTLSLARSECPVEIWSIVPDSHTERLVEAYGTRLPDSQPVSPVEIWSIVPDSQTQRPAEACWTLSHFSRFWTRKKTPNLALFGKFYRTLVTFPVFRDFMPDARHKSGTWATVFQAENREIWSFLLFFSAGLSNIARGFQSNPATKINSSELSGKKELESFFFGSNHVRSD